MPSLSLAFKPIPPWIWRSLSPFDILLDELKPFLRDSQSIKLIVLDGESMQTSNKFYDELACKLLLPNYFGRNLNALDECLCDLEWLQPAGFILLIRAAQKLLGSEGVEALDGFLDVLSRSGKEWSQPITGTSWDRGPIPFHAIFQSDVPTWRQDLPLIGV